jgi:hypothetical protein
MQGWNPVTLPIAAVPEPMYDGFRSWTGELAGGRLLELPGAHSI